MYVRTMIAVLLCTLILGTGAIAQSRGADEELNEPLDRSPEVFSDEDEDRLLRLRDEIEDMRQRLLTRPEKFTREEILKIVEQAQPIFDEIDRLQRKRDRWEAHQCNSVDGEEAYDKPPPDTSKSTEDDKVEVNAQVSAPGVSLFALQPGLYSRAQVVDLLGPVNPARKLQPFNAVTERYALRRVMVCFDAADRLQAIALFFRVPLPLSDIELLFPMQYRPVRKDGDPFGGSADAVVTLYSVSDGLGYVCEGEGVTAIIRAPRRRVLFSDLFDNAIIYTSTSEAGAEESSLPPVIDSDDCVLFSGSEGKDDEREPEA